MRLELGDGLPLFTGMPTTLRARFEESHENPEEGLTDFLEDLGGDTEQFWWKVKTNLQAGKVRLIFVADEISAELRRVVGFLNTQMDPAEVLAVEIKQYVGGKLKTLVPRVMGQTVEAQQKKLVLEKALRKGGSLPLVLSKPPRRAKRT